MPCNSSNSSSYISTERALLEGDLSLRHLLLSKQQLCSNVGVRVTREMTESSTDQPANKVLSELDETSGYSMIHYGKNSFVPSPSIRSVLN